MNHQIKAAQEAVVSMLIMYYTTLCGNVKDPKQVIATELPKLINLSEEQAVFVQQGCKKNAPVIIEGLKNCLQLLSLMKSKQKVDNESIDIISMTLKKIAEEIEDTHQALVSLKEQEEGKEDEDAN